MSDILQKAKQHFTPAEELKVKVPEWGCDIYYKPLTLHERRKIYAVGADGRSPDGVTVLVRCLIAKSLDKSGKPLFSEMDENEILHSVDPAVVSRVSSVMLKLQSRETLDQAGND